MVRKYKSSYLWYLFHAVWITIRAHCFVFAIKVAFLPGICAAVLFVTDQQYDYLKDILPAKEVYSGLTTMITLTVVFHTVQSYIRWMAGITLTYQLLGEFHEAAALLVTFATHSGKNVNDEARQSFLDTLVRLCSMLFAVCIGELEDGNDQPKESKRAHDFGLIDPEGLDEETLDLVNCSPDKPVCVYQRLLDLMMDAFDNGVIAVPAPLFTRSFQELGNGMIKFHECLKFRDTPFPLPFMLVTDTLLMVYTVYTPFMYASWAVGPIGAGCFTFVSLACTWLLHCLAEELDNPFGYDSVDLPAESLTGELNARLLALLQQARTSGPKPSESAVKNLANSQAREGASFCGLKRCLTMKASKSRQSMQSVSGQEQNVQESQRQEQDWPADLQLLPLSASSQGASTSRNDQENVCQDQGQSVQSCLAAPEAVSQFSPAVEGSHTPRHMGLHMPLVSWRLPRTPRGREGDVFQAQTPTTPPGEAHDRSINNIREEASLQIHPAIENESIGKSAGLASEDSTAEGRV